MAAVLEPGDVVALVGPLGAGKTHLVKGVAEGLGLADSREVTSPSFVLINEYDTHPPVYHFDAYRLDGPDALEELGCAEYFDAGGVSLVEWADRVAAALPPEHLHVELTWAGPQDRAIHLVARGPRYGRIVQRLKPDSGPAPVEPG